MQRQKKERIKPAFDRQAEPVEYETLEDILAEFIERGIPEEWWPPPLLERYQRPDAKIKLVQRAARTPQNGGLPKGSKDAVPPALKDAILLAAERSKHSKGGGVVGYLTHIADKHPDLFVRFLAKGPIKIFDIQAKPVEYKTLDDVRADFTRRRIPESFWPPALRKPVVADTKD